MFEKALEAEGTTEADWVSVSFLLGFIKADPCPASGNASRIDNRFTTL